MVIAGSSCYLTMSSSTLFINRAVEHCPRLCLRGGAWQIDTNFYKWPPSLRAQIVLSALQTISQHSFGTAHTPRSNSLISPSEAPFNSLNLQLVVCAAMQHCRLTTLNPSVFFFQRFGPTRSWKCSCQFSSIPTLWRKVAYLQNLLN